MSRHSIKQRWERLGVCTPEWGIPGRVHSGPKDELGRLWKWDRERPSVDRKYSQQPIEVQLTSWPSPDEEYPDERAVRRHLERQGKWHEALVPKPSEASHSTDIHVDDRESLITSRPWYVWQIEVAEEEVRLRRIPKNFEIYDPARKNVTTRWKEKGYWKESWADLPGWKWKHESPSPEPPDPNDMDLTPSEIDAMEEIPPPTPPATLPALEKHRSLVYSGIFGPLPGYDPDPTPLASTREPHAEGDDDHVNNRSNPTVAPVGNKPP